MRILLTNDDGITSPGITLLASSLREAGHKVYLVAPDRNRSGSSHSIVFLNEPVKLAQTEKDSWSCSGTPVDCVIVSLLGGIEEISISSESGEYNMNKAPDLVLSGINVGANLGTDIIYSGTAAAARQGSIFGIPSVALSLVENKGVWHWEPIISYITEKLDEFVSYWEGGAFVNINFPNFGKTPSALVNTFPSLRHYDDHIERYIDSRGDIFCFTKTFKTDNIPDEGSDWSEVLKNNAAFSIIANQPALFSKG